MSCERAASAMELVNSRCRLARRTCQRPDTGTNKSFLLLVLRFVFCSSWGREARQGRRIFLVVHRRGCRGRRRLRAGGIQRPQQTKAQHSAVEKLGRVFHFKISLCYSLLIRRANRVHGTGRDAFGAPFHGCCTRKKKWRTLCIAPAFNKK